jgi:DNA repair exonuclease SbcCD nuclease subunit
MKALIIGDIHVNVKNLQRSKELLDHLNSIIEEKTPSMVIQMGDVFHNHNILHLESLKLYTDFLKKIPKHVKVMQLVGNHDMQNSVTLFPKTHAYVSFNFSNVEIVDTPRVIDNILYMPYVPVGQFHQELNKITDPYKMIFCHQEFIGAEFMKGLLSTTGDALPTCPTISGHVHGQNKLEDVWYCGTPIQHDHGDDEDKAVWMVDLNTSYEVLEKIEIPMPKYKTVKFQIIPGRAIELPSNPNNDVIRFEIEGSKSDMFAFKQSTDYKNLAKTGKIKTVINSCDESPTRKKDYKSFEQLLKEYCQNEHLEHIYSEIVVGKL